MELYLDRKHKDSKYTIGDLYINNKKFCNTIEDTDRDLNDSMDISEIKSKKVYGLTAIPKGTYEIDMNTVSPKFKGRSWAKPYGGKLPRLVGVKGYDGVLMHPGTTEQDTLGCIIPGKNTSKGKVTESVSTFTKLMTELLKARLKGEKITITIN